MEKNTPRLNHGSLEKREHIYRTAMELFITQSYSKTTVRDICRAADTSNGSFYHFFGDKSGILLEFVEHLFAQREDFLSLTEDHIRQPYQVIYNYLVYIADAQDTMGREFSRELLLGNPELLANRQVNTRRQNTQAQICRLLRQAAAEGTISPHTDPERTAEFLITGSGGILFQWLTLAEGESAGAMTRRMLPHFFASVADITLDI